MFPDGTQATKPAQITSAKNPVLKEVRRAIDRGALTSDGLCVAETFHLLDEAIRSGCEIPVVIASEHAWPAVEQRVRPLANVQLLSVAERLFGAVSATESAQGVIALVRPPVWTIAQLFGGQPLVVVLDGIQDPGNAGAIVRAAEAFGATGILFVRGSVSPFNAKTLRASAGSLFRLPFVSGVDAGLALAALAEQSLDIYAAMPRASQTASEADLTRGCAIIVGSEGRGVNPIFEAASAKIRIPTDAVESLNAAMAAGILLYEARRQRQLRE